jgi:hypothetical protein
VIPGFLPGVTSVDAATVFVIEDGTEYTSVNAPLVSAMPTTSEFGTVSGVVLGPDGQRVEAAVALNYRQSPRAVSTINGSSSRTNTTDGQFRFASVMPIAARITATVPGQALRAAQDLTLVGGRVSDVTLQLQPLQEVAGRVTPEGTFSTGRTIVVKSQDGPFGETHEIPVPASGEFQLRLFPGRYIIGSGSSVTIDGADMTDRIFEIRRDAPIKSLVVSFSNEAQEITGRVINTNGDGVSAVTMVAFSTTEADWFHDARRIAIAKPGIDGRYQLGGSGVASLPTGEYYLAAVADLSPDEQYNPAFLRTLVGAAIRITLPAGQTVVQDVRVR